MSSYQLGYILKIISSSKIQCKLNSLTSSACKPNKWSPIGYLACAFSHQESIEALIRTESEWSNMHQILSCRTRCIQKNSLLTIDIMTHCMLWCAISTLTDIAMWTMKFKQVNEKNDQREETDRNSIPFQRNFIPWNLLFNNIVSFFVLIGLNPLIW